MATAPDMLSEPMTDIGGLGTALCRAVAGELRVARGLLEELAGVLVADERFVLDYIDQFQAFDLIVQHIDEGAALLDRLVAGASVEDAVESVRLTSIQERLRAALV